MGQDRRIGFPQALEKFNDCVRRFYKLLASLAHTLENRPGIERQLMYEKRIGILCLKSVTSQFVIRKVLRVERHDHLCPSLDRRRHHMPIIFILEVRAGCANSDGEMSGISA